MADLFQFIDDIDADKQAMVVKRLEDRAQMPKFAVIRENYFDKIGLPITGRIHELGCGTGAVCRAIASRPGFLGTVVGSDLSASLIETAKDMTAKSGMKNIEYYQADGQGSDAHEGQYDLVLAHTVISHVASPAAFLREAIRLARPGGQIILHDGDYASMTLNTNTPELDLKMPGLILQAVVANRYVMREIPRLLRQSDVKITHAFGDVVLEIGNGEYFPSLAKNDGPIAVAEQERADMSLFNIGFVIFPELTQLDFTGPLQVLSRLPQSATHIVAKSAEPVPSDCGLGLVPTHTFANCPHLDLICIPGGSEGVAGIINDRETIEFVRRQAAGAKYITSVCTGAFVLGVAGLLKGRRATTHWAYTDLLPLVGATYEKARVVKDGNVITGGGVTAGIDFGLSVIAEIAGETTAKRIQLGIEYDPAPPFDSGHPDKAPTIRSELLSARYDEFRATYRTRIAQAVPF